MKKKTIVTTLLVVGVFYLLFRDSTPSIPISTTSVYAAAPAPASGVVLTLARAPRSPVYAVPPGATPENIAAAQKKAAAKVKAIKPLVVVRSDWKRGGFNNIALWTVTFRNRSNRQIGDMQYKTRYYTETGRLIDKGSGTIGKIVRAGRVRKLEVNDGFVHPDAASASFTMVGWRYLETEAEAVARSKRERIARAAETARVAKLRAKLIADQQARIDRRLAIEQGGKRWHSLRTGLSKEEVISILGQPRKVVPVGTKENWFFPGSVTAYCIFEDGKLKNWRWSAK